jgi:hypothetical protein
MPQKRGRNTPQQQGRNMPLRGRSRPQQPGRNTRGDTAPRGGGAAAPLTHHLFPAATPSLAYSLTCRCLCCISPAQLTCVCSNPRSRHVPDACTSSQSAPALAASNTPAGSGPARRARRCCARGCTAHGARLNPDTAQPDMAQLGGGDFVNLVGISRYASD